jgi:hypothetical protein
MLRVTDALIDGVPKQVAWGLLGLQEVNAELATPVTPLELELSAVGEGGSTGVTPMVACMSRSGQEQGTSIQGSVMQAAGIG